ncbi:MAG: polysaccharide biosynthesis/export family protein [Propionivibrio sp.]|uniref:Polysaccharide biosynthesis/export family protein n=1 Tax=Candidatus Propionivibrio dominans TaxID=2954373 RepID=A0A9D7I9T0_9RHOO|nr:polysaccharide biosynthesis/export family protein [Candidatus Propionivibrio dominans]MBL0167326.1 polysaccharide biosynthesis/export family protein [Propionivibrio sp.]
MATPRIGLLTLSIVMTTGCASVNYPVPPLPSREEAPAYYKPAVEKDYRLQVSDALAIRSFFEPQLNQEMVVRPDGRISVLLIGELSVAGMRPEDLALKIRESYRRMVGSTDVTVAVTRSVGMNIFLSGEIKSPSLLQLDGDLTLLQAVARAGGFLPSANTGQVLLLRNTDDGTLTVSKVDIEKILRNEAPDVFLQRRDVVYVPKSAVAEAGKFVEQYINAIVPRLIQFQFGWIYSRVRSSDSTLQVTPSVP